MNLGIILFANYADSEIKEKASVKEKFLNFRKKVFGEQDRHRLITCDPDEKGSDGKPKYTADSSKATAEHPYCDPRKSSNLKENYS